MMRKTALLLVLFFSVFSWAQKQPDPNDYPLTVHVSSSRLAVEPFFNGEHTVQVLHVTTNGKKYELKAAAVNYGLLELGDYKARLIYDQHRTSHESYKAYELLLADQTTRKFTVVGQSE